MNLVEATAWWRRASGGRESWHDGLPLFESDVLAGDEFEATFRRTVGAAPERLLMLAILEDAIACLRRYARARDARGRRTFADAAAWLGSDDRTWIFSFRAICDVLEIDAPTLRRAVGRSLDSPGPAALSVADR